MQLLLKYTNKMITVELRGGLGNQLFQYAAGIALSEYHQVDLKVDITQLQEPDEILGTYRRYCLSNLINEPQIAQNENTQYLTNPILKRINKLAPIQLKNVFYENYFHFNPLIWKTKKTIFLRGNFQSFKYFENYHNTILNKLAFKQHFKDQNDVIYNQINSSNSLAIHIRRGDYVSNKIASHVLGTLAIEHYKNAVDIIISKEKIENVFIFSDDIEWVKQNLDFLKNPIFVEALGNYKDITEFILLKSCKHQIIANSSFSWWAAYLNPNPNKIVIAPKKWFNQVDYNTKDLFPADWITI